MSLYQFALLWLVGTNLLAIVLTVSDMTIAHVNNMLTAFFKKITPFMYSTTL